MKSENLFKTLEGFTSKDVSRSTLTGINVKYFRDVNLVELCSTDGHKLIMIQMDIETYVRAFIKEFGVEPKETDHIVYPNKKNRDLVGYGLMSSLETFPKYQNVIPNEYKHITEYEGQQVLFNPEILAQVKKDLTKTFGKNVTYFPQYFTTSMGASMFEVKDPEIEGCLVLIMPLRNTTQKGTLPKPLS